MEPWGLHRARRCRAWRGARIVFRSIELTQASGLLGRGVRGSPGRAGTPQVVVIATIVGLLLALWAIPVRANTPACRVTNLSTNQVYDGSGGNLQTAIDHASPGTHLRIRGVCAGNFSITKRLRLLGVATTAFPVPTMQGD